MRSFAELRGFVRAAKGTLSRERDLGEFEIYAVSAEDRIARIAYTSDIPCRGVEELKSLDADGFQIRIVTKTEPRRVGTAFQAGEFTMSEVRNVLSRARSAAIIDPHFPGLSIAAYKTPSAHRAPCELSRASDAVIAKCAWKVIQDALAAFRRSHFARDTMAGLVLGGDLSIVRDRMALASSSIPELRVDEDAHFSASVTTLVESLDAKGTASATGTTDAAMRAAVAQIGREAVMAALRLHDGVRPAGGNYRVILGPQPIAEILNYMVMGSLTTAAFYASNSAYQGRFGDRVMDERLSLYDDPLARSGAIRRRTTCEGLCARRSELIRDGYLTGLLSTIYDSHQIETDPARATKLGASRADTWFAPVNGYRLGEDGGRRFDAAPASTGTNVILHARAGLSERAMMAAVGDGIYVGRVWYTYPINGQRAGDFTCTISGDSFMIRDGRRAEPVAPNCLRISANLSQVFDSPLAVGARCRPAIVWGSPEAYYIPAIALNQIALSAIGAVAGNQRAF